MLTPSSQRKHPEQQRPSSQGFAPFFAAAGEPPVAEARRMVVAARAVLEGEDPDGAVEQAWYAVDGAARAAFELAEAGALPMAAVEVAAGLTGVARPKDYGVRPIWNVAWALLGEAREQDEALLDEDALEMVASMEAACGPEAARELRDRFAELSREERAERADEEAGGAAAEQGPPPKGERALLADRIALLGAGGSTRSELHEARPLLWINRDCGPAWEALCMAFDVVGAGSFASLDRLGAVVEGTPGSPALLWLDEIACRVAREKGRAARRAAALDKLLGNGGFGKNAAALAISVSLGRRALEENGDRAHDAWLRLAATRRADPPVVARLGQDMPPAERTAIRRAARRGDNIAQMLLEMEEQHEALGKAEREDAEREGPFYGLTTVPPEVEQAIEDVAHAMVLGFRELYGLELLRDALPRLRQAL